jgi:hypothetical protein
LELFLRGSLHWSFVETQTHVRTNPMIDNDAQIIMTTPSPHRSVAGSNERAPNKAPSFPDAADIPFNVDLHRGE